jgi:hypothetical protein
MRESEKDLEYNPYKIVLEKPVQFGKELIETLTLRDLTCKELRTIKLNGDMTIGDLLDIGQKLCETHRKVIDKLCKKDAMELVDRVGFLLEDGL